MDQQKKQKHKDDQSGWKAKPVRKVFLRKENWFEKASQFLIESITGRNFEY